MKRKKCHLNSPNLLFLKIIQEEKRPLLYIGTSMTFILIVINIAIGFYIKDKYCMKNEVETSEKQKEGSSKEPLEKEIQFSPWNTKFLNQKSSGF